MPKMPAPAGQRAKPPISNQKRREGWNEKHPDIAALGNIILWYQQSSLAAPEGFTSEGICFALCRYFKDHALSSSVEFAEILRVLLTSVSEKKLPENIFFFQAEYERELERISAEWDRLKAELDELDKQLKSKPRDSDLLAKAEDIDDQLDANEKLRTVFDRRIFGQGLIPPAQRSKTEIDVLIGQITERKDEPFVCIITVFDSDPGKDAHAMCLYRNPGTDKLYFFDSNNGMFSIQIRDFENFIQKYLIEFYLDYMEVNIEHIPGGTDKQETLWDYELAFFKKFDAPGLSATSGPAGVRRKVKAPVSKGGEGAGPTGAGDGK